MSNQLNIGALPYEPKTQQITKPPQAVEMLVSPQAPVIYHQLPNYPYHQCFHYRRQEAELAHFYSYYYYYYYYNIKSQPQPQFYSVYFQPTEPPSPHADFLGGGEKKQLVETYRPLEAKKNKDDGGFTKFASSTGKRWKVFGCRGKKGCGTQWRPRSSKSAAAGSGGGQIWGLGKTTVMIKNIPNQMRRKLLIEFLDKLCDENNHLAYDFLYLPMDFLRKNNYGYAFVNFTSAFAAKKIKEVLNGYKWGCIQTDSGSFLSHKVCEMTWAKIQGQEALVRHFQNSTFRCESTDWLPVVFCPPRNGCDSTSEQRNVGYCSARSS